MVASGKIAIKVNQTYPLKDVAQAHEDLESRRTTRFHRSARRLGGTDNV